MFQAVKDLVVILGIALVIFKLARPACLHFMRAEDFERRRGVWLTLTAVAFLCPNFWLYVVFAAVLLIWAARRDAHPAALYLLAYGVIPPIYLYVPVVGVNQLFPMTQGRLLALVVLLPVALQLFRRNDQGLSRKWNLFDVAVVAYLGLQIVLALPYESSTATMRRAFLSSLDVLLVFYVFSRALVERNALVDAMTVFVLCAAIYATIGVFESVKGWLLYEQVGPRWGAQNLGAFLLRGDTLRAQASAGHSLTFGYATAMAFGFWLHLRGQIASRPMRWATTAVLCLGIYASHSRGPWLTALLVYFSYLLLSPGGATTFLKGLAAVALLGGLVAMTPVGSKIIDVLPFIGSADQANVLYRQQLAQESFRLILQNPLLGDPFVLAHMEDLRQGQGIIDLMNAYAAVALFSGLTGLACFATLLAGPMIRSIARLRVARSSDPDLSSIGAALVACMIGSLFFMATASVDWVEYVLAGMLCAFASLARGARANTIATRSPAAPGTARAAYR